MWITRITVFSVACIALASGYRNADVYKAENKAELQKLQTLLTNLLSEFEKDRAKATSGSCGNFGDKTRKGLMDALTKKKGQVYIIFEDGYTCSSSEKNELSMYRDIVNTAYLHPSTHLWLSKAPCRACVNPLIAAFTSKPTLHVQSLYYGEASFENEKLKSAVGCMYRVKEGGFPVSTTWNWNAGPLNLSGKKKPSNMYNQRREAFGDIILMIENLKSNTVISDWCTD